MSISNERPDLSVTIVSFNTQELTLQCLKSIYDNIKDISFEIWVVDNNSSDGSQDAIAREFPYVHLICNKDNRGLAAATNQGLEPSTGRYAVALNSDTVILPGAFEKLVRFMDEHPDVGGITPKLLLPDMSLHPRFIGNLPTLKSELLDILSPLHKSIADRLPAARFGNYTDYSKNQEVPCILWGTCFVVRNEVLKTVGLQDPLFFVYGEDTDWAIRIVRAGWKLYYLADAEVIHYGGQSTKQSSTRMMAQLCKSRCRFIQKHYGIAAGITLRSVIGLFHATVLLKWMLSYMINPSGRQKASARIDQMWCIIRAVLVY